jgi:putative inorganic carbon (HCO3(-)) transporter
MTRVKIGENNTEKHNKLFIMFLALVFILPWPHGGEVNWQYLAFAFTAFVMLAYYLISYALMTSKTTPQLSSLNSIKMPLLLLIIWVIYSLIQVIPLPKELVNVISPTSLIATENINLITQNNPDSTTTTLSIAPNTSLIEIIKYSSYVIFFLLAFLLINSKKRLIQLTTTLFLSSLSIAIYSIIDYYSAGSASIIAPLPPWDFYSHEIIHGSFSYKNHYAAFLILTIPLGFGLAYIDTKNSQNTNILMIADFLLSKKSSLLIGSILMVIVLIMSASRAGNGALLISLIGVLAFTIFIKKSGTSKKPLINISIASLIFILLIFFTGVGDKLISRYETASDNGRQKLINTVTSIFKEYPIVGSGPGTFPVLHQQYKSPNLNGSIMWQRAHNDYLELLSTQGIIGFSLLGAAIFLLYFRLAKGLKLSINKNTKNLYGLQVAGFCSVTAMLIHSLADFNFQLPANTVYFFVILAIGIRAKSLNTRQ